jgi:hypothetical protein
MGAVWYGADRAIRAPNAAYLMTKARASCGDNRRERAGMEAARLGM